MTDGDFNARFAASVQDAEDALVREGFVGPLFGFLDHHERATVLVGDFTSDASKAATFQAAQLTAVAEDAAFVFHRTEAWIVIGESLALGVAPFQSERRREVVLIVAASRRNGKRTSMREIVRGLDGRPIGTAALGLPPGDTDLVGRFSELLPAERPTGAERRAARAALARVAKRKAGSRVS